MQNSVVELNPYRTLIAAAEVCPVTEGVPVNADVAGAVLQTRLLPVP
jgi:hypothetical protein